MKKKNKLLITSALPYANGEIHFGHLAGAYLPADIYARFMRMQDDTDVLFLCGSDEYGIAIEISAEINKTTPKKQIDLYHNINKKIFHLLNISFDHYSRTTWEGHKQVVLEFFNDLLENGYIEKITRKHLFSQKENKFLADRYVEGTCPKCKYEKARGDECPKCSASYEANDLINPISKLTQSPLIKKDSTHWYIKFDKFKDKLSKWLKTKNFKPNVMKFTENYLKNLKERSITRDSKWGIPFPLDKDKVFYVWFDAPIGYISAAKEWALLNNQEDKYKDFWLDEKTKLVNFIGKDNIPFHAIFFPAMIMGQNKPYKLADEIPANEFLLLEGKQFSKSDNWYKNINDFLSTYSVDQIRYYLTTILPETRDSEFSFNEFYLKNNSDLVGKFGNFINRVLTFLKKHFSSKIPSPNELREIDKSFLDNIEKCIKEIKIKYESFELKKAAKLVMEIASQGNIYFNDQKPWILIKEKEENKQNLNNIFYCCIECIKKMALSSYPIIPSTACQIFELIGIDPDITKKETWDNCNKKELNTNITLPEAKILFKKIESSQVEEELEKLKGKRTL